MEHITKVDEEGLTLLKSNEAFRSSPYLDKKTGKGVSTIGFGFTYYPNGTKVTMQDPPISMEWADVILQNILHHYEVAVDTYTIDELTQHQFNALVDTCYNIGIENFKTSTLLKLVNKNPNDLNIALQFRRWIYDDGVKVTGLVNRRERAILEYFKK